LKRGYAQDNFKQSQGAGETIRAGVHVVAPKVWHDSRVVKILKGARDKPSVDRRELFPRSSRVRR
jgi:hypothetical protein